MFKTFLLIALHNAADGAQQSYVMDYGLTYEDCAFAVESMPEGMLAPGWQLVCEEE